MIGNPSTHCRATAMTIGVFSRNLNVYFYRAIVRMLQVPPSISIQASESTPIEE